MKPSEIRSELLGQHADLRSLMDATCASTERWAQSAAGLGETRYRFACLLDALSRHNQREEQLLRALLPGVDAWGPARAEIMNDEHAEEHRELSAALQSAATTTDADLALRLLRDVRTRLLEHMAREEKGFLGEDALRDDEPHVDAFGG